MEAIQTKAFIRGIKGELGKIIVEQEKVIDLILIAILTNGHLLLEGVPGLGKTLLIKSLAKTMGVDFKRVQFTPDLMPSDITGARIYNIKEKEFKFIKGPIFTNLLLGDEINRTPPKTQAGLLEAMEERRVTIDGESYKLEEPFIVFATQNPIEYEGTYPLPEALLDRFLMKVHIDYPSIEGEVEIMKKYHKGFDKSLYDIDIKQIGSSEDILNCQREIANITVEDLLIEYMVNIIQKTRESPFIEIGSSPRGSISLLQASKANAVLMERDFVIPEDIKKVAYPVLRHRITLKPEAYVEGIKPEDVIHEILSNVKVPR
ncbi:MoxR family ATPase [Crassaminicella thermophila]|uniref:MoxR family ATPase n=1 Tax=Crassaminicella thermophila TaxID=2599308 RepID=A0A5C0SIB8_CRATE|nr:MoxR family ATPase [Crassaminicella thermophila]QEK12679.1 MoxR family ATPase [Crassaminicella thermophila]